ncbi:hypothetical protein KDL29_13285 [bacterium]|nr:hypothetical protein [bacterium]
MTRQIAIIAMLLILPLAGCNKGGSNTDASAAAAQAAPAVSDELATSADATAIAEEVKYEPQAGHELALGDDEKVIIVSVADLDSKAKDMEGLVALEGRVAESYPDKGTIILVDCDNMKGCQDGCCPQTRVPVRLGAAEGSEQQAVPAVDEYVIVVAELSLTETGYNLAVREVRPAKLG